MYSYRTVQTTELKNNRPDGKIRTQIQAVFSLAVRLVLEGPGFYYCTYGTVPCLCTCAGVTVLGLCCKLD